MLSDIMDVYDVVYVESEFEYMILSVMSVFVSLVFVGEIDGWVKW